MNLPMHSQVKFAINTTEMPDPVPVGSIGVIINTDIDGYYEVLFECGYYGFYHISELEIVE